MKKISKPQFSKNIICMLTALISLSSCGGGASPTPDATSPTAGNAAGSVANPPAGGGQPAGSGSTSPVALASMRDCFALSNTPATFVLGIANPDGTFSDATLVEQTSQTASANGRFLRRESITDTKGGFTKFSENVTDLSGNAITPVSTQVFSPLDVATSTYVSGAQPLDLAVGQLKDYTLNYTITDTLIKTIVSNSSDYSERLMAIGPLQTKGKFFPLSCQIELIQKTFNGKAINNRYVSWTVPGYGVVKSDLYRPDGRVEVDLELVRVQAGP